MNGVNYNEVVITLSNNSCMIVKKGITMGEFVFWIILIPLLFYIVVGTFSKECHPNDTTVKPLEDEYGDE